MALILMIDMTIIASSAVLEGKEASATPHPRDAGVAGSAQRTRRLHRHRHARSLRNAELDDARIVLLGAVTGCEPARGRIGIMDIMLVSVTEDAPRIGVGSRSGAQPRNCCFAVLIRPSCCLALGGGRHPDQRPRIACSASVMKVSRTAHVHRLLASRAGVGVLFGLLSPPPTQIHPGHLDTSSVGRRPPFVLL